MSSCNPCAQPAAPDMAAAATAQGQANLATAQQQSLLNNPNMVTPYGTSTYSGPTDGSGRPTVTQSLSPAEQAKLSASDQAQISSLGILNQDMPNISSALLGPFGLAGTPQMGYTAGQTPTNLSFAGAPPMPQANAGVLQQVEDAMYGQGAQYLDPQFAQKKSDLTSQLANQGIVPGTAAYDREMLNFNNQSQKAYQDLRDSSITGGQTAMQQLYNEALSGRQQGVNEATTQGTFAQAGVGQAAQIAANQMASANAARQQQYGEYTANRTMPLNMLNAMISNSQVNNPTFQPTTPTAITPAPVLQGAIAQGQVNSANAGANAGLWGNVLKAGGALGSAAITASDRRLKTEIRRIGTRYNLPWYSFNILGEAREGVMADEAPAHAVVDGPCGFKMVDYGRL